MQYEILIAKILDVPAYNFVLEYYAHDMIEAGIYTGKFGRASLRLSTSKYWISSQSGTSNTAMHARRHWPSSISWGWAAVSSGRVPMTTCTPGGKPTWAAIRWNMCWINPWPACQIALYFRNKVGNLKRSAVKIFLGIVIAFFVFLILACLPVVPISIAPVVLNATYSSRMFPFLEILWFLITRPDGVSYQWHWYTFAVMLILLAIGCMVSILVFRKIGGSTNNWSCPKIMQPSSWNSCQATRCV